MIYMYLKLKLGVCLNFVIGFNGIGKSFLVCVIGIGFVGEFLVWFCFFFIFFMLLYGLKLFIFLF